MWRRKRRLHLLVRRFPKRRIENSSAPGEELTNDDPVCSFSFAFFLFVSSIGLAALPMHGTLTVSSWGSNTSSCYVNNKYHAVQYTRCKSEQEGFAYLL